MDGFTAVWQVERRACDVAGIYPPPDEAGAGPSSSSNAEGITVRAVESGPALGGLMAGWAATGLRAAAFTQGRGLAEMRASLAAAARQRLPYVVHHACAPLGSFPTSVQGGHDDYFTVADAGVFQLFARNVQEAADFALIARRIAEEALHPGLCAYDGNLTAASVQILHLPEPDLVADYLGAPADRIACPTPAQEILFGASRRRVPVLFDLDRPLGLGVARDQEAAFQALAGQGPFFFDPLAGIIDAALATFGEKTGRRYARASGYRLDDAACVIAAQGAVVEALRAVVDELRARERIKVGVLNLTLFRPFPGDLVTKLLQGKQAVTVLERAHHPLAEDLPLLREIRCAVGKAVENGMAGEGALPHPGYAVYGRDLDRPRFFSGVYGKEEGTPSFAELYAVVRNMLLEGDGKTGYVLGARFDRPDVRLPGLERLQQRIRQGYPGLAQRALTAATPARSSKTATGQGVFQLHTVAGVEGRSVGAMLARALFGALGWSVRTTPHEDAHQRFRRSLYTLAHADEAPPGATDEVDAILVAAPALLQDPATLARLQPGGLVVLHAEGLPDDLWAALPAAARRRVRDRELRLYTLDARRCADEVADGIVADPRRAEARTLHALLGAFLKVYPRVDAGQIDLVRDAYRRQLADALEGRAALVDEQMAAWQRGAEAVAPLAWDVLPAEASPALEPEAPWTVRAVTRPDGTVYDLARFWDSVGYLYETGQREKTLTDPFVAAGTMPARSSAFRNLAPLRTTIPRLLPERCTACGACWAVCPDTALPATIQDAAALVETALARCEAAGHSLIQMRRVGKHLAQQAHRLAARDDLHRYRTLGDLLHDAFARLLDLTNPKDDQRRALEDEFQLLHETAAAFPIVKTETFFKDPEKAAKGSGLLFSLAVNPDACKACTLCVAACPEEALEAVAQTATRLDEARRAWDFLMQLPDVPTARIQPFLLGEQPETLVYHLLNRRVYHAMLGGDQAAPGHGVKTAMHLFVAAVEAVMQPRLQAFVEQLSDLIAQIEDRIQGSIARALRVNDFEAFGQKLSRLEGTGLGLDALAEILGDEAETHDLDKERLRRLAALLEPLKTLRRQYREAAHGDGRARLAATLGTDDAARWHRTYPYNPYPFPWIYHLAGEAAAVAEGVFEGVMRQVGDGFKHVRTARLALDDTYDPAQHDAFFERFGWQDFTPDEWALCPPLVVVADDRSRPLAPLLRSPLPLKVLLVNGQRFAWTDAAAGPEHAPPGVWTEPGLAALAHRNVFVLQAGIGTPGRFIRGVLEGVAFRGPALFHVCAPDPIRHGIAPDQVAEQARRAVKSRAFPMFTYHPEGPGDFREHLDLDGNPEPEQDWAAHTWRVADASGLPTDVEGPYTVAHWAAREGRFQRHFRLMPPQDWNAEMIPLVDFLALPPEERAGRTPFIQVEGSGGQLARMAVSPAMAALTEERRAAWRLLLELAGVRSSLATHHAEKARTAVEREVERRTAALTAEYDARAARREQTHAGRYHAHLTQRLLALSGYGPQSEKARTALREYGKRGEAAAAHPHEEQDGNPRP